MNIVEALDLVRKGHRVRIPGRIALKMKDGKIFDGMTPVVSLTMDQVSSTAWEILEPLTFGLRGAVSYMKEGKSLMRKAWEVRTCPAPMTFDRPRPGGDGHGCFLRGGNVAFLSAEDVLAEDWYLVED